MCTYTRDPTLTSLQNICYVRKSSGPLFLLSLTALSFAPTYYTDFTPNIACYLFCLMLPRLTSCTISRAMSCHRPTLTQCVFPTFLHLPYLPG
jgi:hypothetical protein